MGGDVEWERTEEDLEGTPPRHKAEDWPIRLFHTLASVMEVQPVIHNSMIFLELLAKVSSLLSATVV